MSDDTISRQEAIDALMAEPLKLENSSVWESARCYQWMMDMDVIKALPSAQPEIIRCNSCKHWTQSTGKMKGLGLGRCDFHDADLVTCNGYCYWAERRTDELGDS